MPPKSEPAQCLKCFRKQRMNDEFSCRIPSCDGDLASPFQPAASDPSLAEHVADSNPPESDPVTKQNNPKSDKANKSPATPQTQDQQGSSPENSDAREQPTRFSHLVYKWCHYYHVRGHCDDDDECQTHSPSDSRFKLPSSFYERSQFAWDLSKDPSSFKDEAIPVTAQMLMERIYYFSQFLSGYEGHVQERDMWMRIAIQIMSQHISGSQPPHPLWLDGAPGRCFSSRS